MIGLSDEMKSLKELVKALTSEVRHHATPQVPEEMFDHYMQLIQNEVSEEVAQETPVPQNACVAPPETPPNVVV